MRLSGLKRFLAVVVVFLIFISGAVIYDNYIKKDNERDIFEGDEFPPPTLDYSSDMAMRDNQSLYAIDDDGSVVDIYVTVLPPESSKYSTYDELVTYKMRYAEGKESPIVKVYFQKGDENGPKGGFLGKGNIVSNATMEVRGRSSTNSYTKSFKIKLIDKEAMWGGQTTLNLNYHPGDNARVRNKLSFDLFETVPNISSCRTQFVRLHVKDKSKGKNNDFEDLGLYTHVEQVNKRYLKYHGLDGSGSLYKANSFEFYRYPESIKLVTDPTYDKKVFESKLGIRGNKDHTDLIRMLDAVNNYSLDIDDVVDQYFDRDNYLTWLACNIITGNMDTTSQNYLIYSPQAIEKFYFIPWDYDGAWGWVYGDMTDEELNNYINVRHSDWQFGIQNLWGTVLHNRFLRKPANVAALDKKIEELMPYFTPEKVREQLKAYYPVISESMSTKRDYEKLRTTPEVFTRLYNKLPDMPQKNYDIYVDSKKRPMPFFINPAVREDGEVVFSWGESYDLQNNDITYDVIVSKTPDMSMPVLKKTGLTTTRVSSNVANGVYYVKVVATDSDGNKMGAFDRYADTSRNRYFATRQVEVQ